MMGEVVEFWDWIFFVGISFVRMLPIPNDKNY